MLVILFFSNCKKEEVTLDRYLIIQEKDYNCARGRIEIYDSENRRVYNDELRLDSNCGQNFDLNNGSYFIRYKGETYSIVIQTDTTTVYLD